MMAMCPFAAATPITGIVYQGIPDASNAADPASIAVSLPQASFTVGPGRINFTSGDSDADTPANFLSNPTFTNQQNGFDPNGVLDNS